MPHREFPRPRGYTVSKVLHDVRLLRLVRTGLEVAVLALAFASAYAYRFALPLPPDRVDTMLQTVAPVVLLVLACLRGTGAHRHSWRYTGLHDVADVIKATTLATAVLLVLRYAPGTPAVARISLGVILANWVLTTVGLNGVRMLRRLQSERAEAHRRAAGDQTPIPVLLIGAGRAGVMVANEIGKRPDLRLTPVGFVDDDRRKQGRRIAGLDVLGTTDDLHDLGRSLGVRDAIITMASVSRGDIQRILDTCKDADLETKIIPGLFEIVGGHVNLSRIRPVSVEDLLGRDPVDLDPTSLHELLAGKTVMVTGAGGSIGAELARQAARFSPSRLILVERAESALWRIERDLARDYPTLAVEACIGDVCDEARMRRLFEDCPPEVVAHAAAHKHVPMMEQHPGEAVKNNVGGTKVVADLAAEFTVEHLVLVSTDKAVNPSSVMGATKRLSERYVQHVADQTGLNFVAVRFGNVLGSAGSVVPIFEEQVRQGGPVTVTHPEMMRYFMTIPEASGLVLQATALGHPGEILVLDMGAPVRIVDLAENVIRLSGFEPGRDIPIEFTGLRPGEKLFEELSLSEEGVERTRHPKVWIGRNHAPDWENLDTDIRALLRATDAAAPEKVRTLLRWMVPEFTNGSEQVAPSPTGGDVAKVMARPNYDAASTTPL